MRWLAQRQIPKQRSDVVGLQGVVDILGQVASSFQHDERTQLADNQSGYLATDAQKGAPAIPHLHRNRDLVKARIVFEALLRADLPGRKFWCRAHDVRVRKAQRED